LWLIALTSWGCHAPDDAVVLSRWTLLSESTKPDIAIVLPRILDDLVPRSQPKYTIRTTVERPASWAGQSMRFVFPDLDTEVVLRVNGEAAIVTQKPLFGGPIGRGARQWVVPAAQFDKDSTILLELEFENAWYMSTWLDTVPYMRVEGSASEAGPGSLNQAAAIIAIAIVMISSLTMFLLWLGNRRDFEALLYAGTIFFLLPWFGFELGVMQNLFGRYSVNLVGIAVMASLTLSFYLIHSVFSLGRVPRLVPIVLGGFVVITALLGNGAGRAVPYLVSLISGAGMASQTVIALRLVLRKDPPLHAWLNVGSWVTLLACALIEIPGWLALGEPLGGLRLISVALTAYCVCIFVALSLKVAQGTKQAEALNTELRKHLCEKQEVKDALSKANQAWRTTFDAIGAGVCLLDRDAHILRANRAMAVILGQPLETLPGLALTETIAGEAWLPVKSTATDASQGPTPQGQVLIEHAKRWYSMAIDPVVDDGQEASGNVCVMTDITQQRELEAQLFQTQKMDAVGRLAGGVAHDFNNLLSVIIACGEFITEECSDEKARADAAEIVAAGHRAAELTRHLLDFSRKQVLRPKLQSPNLIITELAKMLRRLIGEELTLEIVLDPEVGFVYFDKGQLEQVLVNLVVNARDASTSGGKITVETKLIEMEVSSPGWGIKRSGIRMAISVIDQGVGMTDEVKKKVFDPFFTTKEQGKGTGLGLSMVYGAVTQVGGVIEINSSPGAGSTFTIFLPHYTSKNERLSLVEELKQMTGSGETILLVDDDAAVRATMSRILRAGGYRVIEAGSGAEALDMFEKAAQDISLLLSDIVMPGMKGTELGVALQQKKPSLAILYVSGYGFEVITTQGLEPSTLNIVSKPFSRAELLDAVAKALRPG
jgi:PAS domain S-box-containing protein